MRTVPLEYGVEGVVRRWAAPRSGRPTVDRHVHEPAAARSWACDCRVGVAEEVRAHAAGRRPPCRAGQARRTRPRTRATGRAAPTPVNPSRPDGCSTRPDSRQESPGVREMRHAEAADDDVHARCGNQQRIGVCAGEAHPRGDTSRARRSCSAEKSRPITLTHRDARPPPPPHRYPVATSSTRSGAAYPHPVEQGFDLPGRPRHRAGRDSPAQVAGSSHPACSNSRNVLISVHTPPTHSPRPPRPMRRRGRKMLVRAGPRRRC